MQAWIVKFFKSGIRLTISRPHDALLLTEVVKIAQMLNDFGFYRDDGDEYTLETPNAGQLVRLAEMIDPLLDLFDARTGNGNWKRKMKLETSPNTQDILDCRLCIAKMLDSVLDKQIAFKRCDSLWPLRHTMNCLKRNSAVLRYAKVLKWVSKWLIQLQVTANQAAYIWS